MLTIVIDGGSDSATIDPIVTTCEDLDIVVEMWASTDPVPLGADVIVTEMDRLDIIEERIERSSEGPRIVVLTPESTTADTRRLLSNGAIAIIPTTGVNPIPQVFAIVASASGAIAGLPADHGHSIASRLEEPPRSLSPDEAYYLGLTATHSIEHAGSILGLSRRQAQRRFRQLCDALGLANRLEASVKAARWGLVDATGAPTVTPAHP